MTMIHLLGAALAAGAAAYLGFSAAAALSRRVRALEDMVQGLSLLEQELELDSPPLPQLMERLARRCRGPALSLVRECRLALDRLEEEDFSTAWRRAVSRREELGEAGRQALLPLGDTLGRCGWEDQRRAAECVRRRLEELACQARQEGRGRGRVYRALGLTGGAFLVILLL